MFDIIGKRNWFFLFSLLVTIPGFIFIVLTPLTGGKEGLQFSVDYTGGTVWQLSFANPNANPAEVLKVLEANDIKGAEVTEDSAHQFTIRTAETDLVAAPTLAPSPTLGPSGSVVPSGSVSPAPSASATTAPSASPSVSPSPSASPSPSVSPSPSASPAGCQRVIPQTGKLAKAAQAMEKDPNLGRITCTGLETTVGPIVSSELIQNAVWLILIGSAGILAWIGIRFNSIKFGTTAVIALVHDVIVVVGTFAVLGTFFGVEIDALFVTAMLTVIGFSVHDTIVVFDRIRENRTRHAGEPFDAIVNHSILQTFGRSINTSLTVVVTLSALLLFGGASIHNFVLALLIGIISGTYSSIFNASPLLVVWQLWTDNRRARELALARSARRK